MNALDLSGRGAILALLSALTLALTDLTYSIELTPIMTVIGGVICGVSSASIESIRDHFGYKMTGRSFRALDRLKSVKLQSRLMRGAATAITTASGLAPLYMLGIIPGFDIKGCMIMAAFAGAGSIVVEWARDKIDAVVQQSR